MFIKILDILDFKIKIKLLFIFFFYLLSIFLDLLSISIIPILVYLVYLRPGTGGCIKKTVKIKTIILAWHPCLQ